MQIAEIKTRAVLCDLKPSKVLKAAVLKSGQVVSDILYSEGHMLESSNSQCLHQRPRVLMEPSCWTKISVIL